MNKFAEMLKELRNEEGLTQQQLAEALKYNRYNVSDWEQGRVEPGYDVLIKIAKYFGVSTDYLLGVEK